MIFPSRVVVMLLLCRVRAFESSIPVCPHGEIGRSLEVQCKGAENASRRATIWYLRWKPSRIFKKLHPFRSDLRQCNTGHNYYLTGHNTLVICNVHEELHGSTLQCNVKQHKKYVCKLEVYSKPQNPVCTSAWTGQDVIYVECGVEAVFPDVHCEISEIKDSRTMVRKVSNISYSTSRGSKFTNICAAHVKITVPDTYYYVAVAYPKLSGDIDVRKLSAASSITEKIVIEGNSLQTSNRDVSVSLTTQLEPFGKRDIEIDFCEANSGLLDLHCITHGFISPPDVRWSFDGMTTSLKHVVKYEANKTIRFTVAVNMSEVAEVHSVECAVSSSEVDVPQTDAVLVHNPARHKPVLASAFDETLEKEEIQVSTAEKSRTFACIIPGDPVGEWYVGVRCSDTDNGSLQPVLKTSKPGVRAEFKVNGSGPARWVCECSASLPSHCYTATSRLLSVAKGRDQPPSDKDIPREFQPLLSTDSLIILAVIAGAVGLILFASFLVCFFCHVCPEPFETEHPNEDVETEYPDEDVVQTDHPNHLDDDHSEEDAPGGNGVSLLHSYEDIDGSEMSEEESSDPSVFGDLDADAVYDRMDYRNILRGSSALKKIVYIAVDSEGYLQPAFAFVECEANRGSLALDVLQEPE